LLVHIDTISVTHERQGHRFMVTGENIAKVVGATSSEVFLAL